jgi:hypothetical protein
VTGESCKGYVVYSLLFTSIVKIGSCKPRLERDHDSWVKCATSAECYETDISVVLTVMSGLERSID